MKLIRIVIFFLFGFATLGLLSQTDRSNKLAKAPEITLDKSTHDLGTLYEGEKLMTTYRYRNTGNSPLIISKIETEASCTILKDWKKIPIHPGEKSEFTVVFDSKNMINQQTKTITIHCNTKISKVEVALIANVLPLDDETVNNELNEYLILENTSFSNELDLIAEATQRVDVEAEKEEITSKKTLAIIRKQIKKQKIEEENAKKWIKGKQEKRKTDKAEGKQNRISVREDNITLKLKEREALKKVNFEKHLKKEADIKARLQAKKELTTAIQTKTKERKLAIAQVRQKRAQSLGKPINETVPIKPNLEVEELEKAKLESEQKQFAETQAKQEAEKNENERLKKETEEIAKLEAVRKLEADKLERLRLQKEAAEMLRLETERKKLVIKQAKLEAERIEKARIKKETEEIARIAAAQKLKAEKKLKLEAERLERIRVQKEAEEIAKLEIERKQLAEKQAKLETERIEKERLRIEAKEIARLAVARKLEEEKKAKLEAERLERIRVQKEAEEIAKLEIERKQLAEKQAKLETERIEKERLRIEAKEIARLAAARKLEEEKKAKLEAERLERIRVQKEAEEIARLEIERKQLAEIQAKLEAERIENERLRIEAKEIARLATAHKLEAEKLAKLEAEKLESIRLQNEAKEIARLETERKQIALKQAMIETERLESLRLKKEAEELAKLEAKNSAEIDNKGNKHAENRRNVSNDNKSTKRIPRKSRRQPKIVLDPNSVAGKIAAFQEEIDEYEVKIIQEESKLQRDKKKGNYSSKKIREKQATILNYKNKVKNLYNIISELKK